MTHPGKKSQIDPIIQILQVEIPPHDIGFIVDFLLLVPAEDNAAGPDHFILVFHGRSIQYPHIAGNPGGEPVFDLPGNPHL